MNDWSAEKSTRDIANFRPILISSKRTSSGFSYGLQHPEFRDVGFRDILLDPVNWRFFSQFFSLVSLFSLPLAGLLTQSSTLLDWLLLPSTPLIAYGLAFWFLPVSLYIPIVIALLYGFENQVFRETMLAGWLEVENIFPPFSQVAVGICMGVLLLALTNSLICSLLKRQSVNTARLLFIVGVSLSTILGAWISTQSLIVTGFIGFTVGTYSYFFQDRLQIGRDVNDVAAVVAGRIVPSVVPSVVLVVALGGALVVVDGIADGSAESFAFGASSLVASLVASLAATGVALFVEKNIAGLVGVVVALLLAVVVGVVVGVVVALLLAVVVAVVITVFSKTELLPFLAIAAVLAFSLSYGQRRWSGLIAAALLAVLGVENLGWRGLWVLPVTISFYYRLLPDYIFFAPMLLTLKLNFLNRTSTQGSSVQNIEQKLSRLPPFSSELLWLPLPGHAQLLAGVFQRNATFGLSSLKKMQLSILPGLPQTVKDALPDIVADQLLKFNHVAEFESLESEPEHFHTHPLLRTLLPRYFDITQNSNQIDYPTSADLSNIFPRLQRIAEDVAAALQSENLTLRERGLERVLEKLNLLTSQLPGLGLKTNDIKRWQPVISRWLNLIEIELSEQKKLSRRELRNPFQYGNPLQRTQGNLFKGRQDFADNIVRLLLNHNRPTIVLHGPRRCGKTSFLNNLPRLLPSDWVPIYVDMQSAAATADEISFLRTLARSIRRDGRSQGISIPDEPDRGSLQAAPYDTFETWLEAVLTELSPRQLLLNLDEFEKISAAIDQGKLSLTLFDELRSLIQHWPQLGFVFSGVQTLEEIGPNWSSYFISVVPIEILYLNPQEAQQLLTDPDPDFALTYAPGLVDGILQLTQCHPNLLQLIGAALVTEANERHTTAVTATMLEAAIPRALTLGTSYFTNVWDEFTGTLNTPDEIRAGQTILKAMAEGQSLPSNLNSTARAALRRMVRYHVLKVEDGHYDFEIPLIKRWVQERAILDE
jgi:hypothetical protein